MARDIAMVPDWIVSLINISYVNAIFDELSHTPTLYNVFRPEEK